MLTSILKKKRAQVDFAPAMIIAIVIALLIMAPIMLRIISTVTGTFFLQMNDTAPEAVREASGAVDTVYHFFDYLVVIFLFVNIIVMFISAWFIDTYPVFIVLYIMFAFIFVLFLPNLLDAVDAVWDKTSSMDDLDPWREGSINLTYTDWIRRNLIMFMIIIFGLTGIITYAKFKLTQGGF
jgi:hypothetical protein